MFLMSAFIGCSEKEPATEITIRTEAEPRRTIRITVEGQTDVIIDDPFIEEIELLSKEYKRRRAQFAKEHRELTREQVNAYSQYADTAADQMRELQTERKSYILGKMKEYKGTSYTTDTEAFSGTLEETTDYFKDLQPSN